MAKNVEHKNIVETTICVAREVLAAHDRITRNTVATLYPLLQNGWRPEQIGRRRLFVRPDGYDEAAEQALSDPTWLLVHNDDAADLSDPTWWAM